MSTNTKLAEALRRLIGASMVAMTDQELATGETLSAWEDANEALAAHDAEQAALRDLECPPDPEMVDRALAAADQKRAYALAARQQAQVPSHGWTDADADAARLALELECILLDPDTPMPLASRWWGSAHEALALHRQRLASEQSHGIGATTGKGPA